MSDQQLAELAHRIRGQLSPIATCIAILKMKCHTPDTHVVFETLERKMNDARVILDELRVR